MAEGAEQQGEQHEWVASFPEEVQEWDEVKNSDSPETFWKQVSDMRSYLGKSIRIPGEDASSEARDEFVQKLRSHVPELIPTPDAEDSEAMETILRALGKPESVDGYKMPDDLDTAGIDIDQTKVDAYLPLFHELGISQRQAEGLIRAAVENDVTAILEHEKIRKADMETLQDDWGVRYDSRRDMALALAKKTGAPEALVNAIQKNTADAATLKWLFGLTKQLSQEGQEVIDQEASSGGLSPEDAQGKIDDIMTNKEHPYWKQSHPRHKAAVDRMVELRRIASGKR